MRFFDLLETVEAPVFALALSQGAEPRILFWSRRMETLTGLPRGAVLKRPAARALGPAAASLSRFGPEGGTCRLPGLGTVVFRPMSGDRLIGTVTVPPAGAAGEDEREAFLAMAAHDLRRPLRNVATLAGILAEEGAGPGRTDDLIGKIRSVGERALDLTNEIVAGVQASALADGVRTEVDLGALCSTVFATLDPRSEHALACRPALLVVDKPLLLIGLRNLIDNALRHGGERRLAILVSAAPQGRRGWLSVTVADDGEGFRGPARAYLAGGKFRYDSGYGLYGFRRLVHARGGTIAIAPAETGSGSVVRFTLPGDVLSMTGERGVARAS